MPSFDMNIGRKFKICVKQDNSEHKKLQEFDTRVCRIVSPAKVCLGRAYVTDIEVPEGHALLDTPEKQNDYVQDGFLVVLIDTDGVLIGASLLEELTENLTKAQGRLEAAQEEARAARQTVQYIRSEISRLQRKVNNLTCWCCSCANRSDAHFGCVACHVRSDVQSWLDATSKKAVPHGHEYLCPPPGTPQCPGWVQGDPPTMED